MIKEGSVQSDLWGQRGRRIDGNGGLSASERLLAVLTGDAWCFDRSKLYQIQASLLLLDRDGVDLRLAYTSTYPST